MNQKSEYNYKTVSKEEYDKFVEGAKDSWSTVGEVIFSHRDGKVVGMIRPDYYDQQNRDKWEYNINLASMDNKINE